MSSKINYFLNKTLGKDFLESLAKTELYKPGTRSVNDIDDMLIGLKIVPRTLMSFLVKELAPMSIGETKELEIPVKDGVILKVTKQERDQYTGEILEDHKIVVDLKYRSIPGIGLAIMSAYELYNHSDLESKKEDKDLESKVQKIIDDRLALRDLISKVVDKKLEQKEAINKIILHKLTESIEPKKEIKIEQPLIIPKEKKISKFREFMERKKKPKEFSIEMKKNEQIHCPDCGKNIFNGKAYSGCICFGLDQESKIYIKKSEDGIKIRFGRGWDQENISMLLDLLRNKHE